MILLAGQKFEEFPLQASPAVARTPHRVVVRLQFKFRARSNEIKRLSGAMLAHVA